MLKHPTFGRSGGLEPVEPPLAPGAWVAVSRMVDKYDGPVVRLCLLLPCSLGNTDAMHCPSKCAWGQAEEGPATGTGAPHGTMAAA